MGPVHTPNDMKQKFEKSPLQFLKKENVQRNLESAHGNDDRFVVILRIITGHAVGQFLAFR